jgi:hypothetical protein
MRKDTNIPSEIRNFFSEKRCNTAFSAFSKLVETFHFSNKRLGGEKRENSQWSNSQLFLLVLLMPFFEIEKFSHYSKSVFNKMFGGQKDVFYDFMSKDCINWRSIVYHVVKKNILNIVVRKDYKKSNLPSVLIVDDSDLPKTGYSMEMIGKIFSHVQQKCILGYKMLAMCWSDGRTQQMLDFSLHGEIGKIGGKEQGLTAKQREKRHARERDEQSHITERKNEYFKGKGDRLIEMVKEAIKAKIPFEYLLVDSWFTNTKLVDYVSHNKKKFHLLGMAKLGNTKYKTQEWGDITTKAIITALSKRKKGFNRSRRYHCHYATIDAVLGGRNVRLFLCKRGTNERWRVLLTTNMELDFMKAYEIYSMRWAIEVFFSDAKRYLQLGDCSARDFSAHIAHISIVFIRYNLLSVIKRSNDYETIGGLFKDIYTGVHELTVVEKIWAIILEVVAILSEAMDADEEKMIKMIIDKDDRLMALKTYAETA